jgi:hypothetical protein
MAAKTRSAQGGGGLAVGVGDGLGDGDGVAEGEPHVELTAIMHSRMATSVVRWSLTDEFSTAMTST